MKPKDIARMVQNGELKPFGLCNPDGEKVNLPWRVGKPLESQKESRLEFLRKFYSQFQGLK
jgi:hypothetical protein